MFASLLESILTKNTLIFLEPSMRYLGISNNQLKTNSTRNKISTRLLGLEFKSDNVIKSKAIKFIVKNISRL